MSPLHGASGAEATRGARASMGRSLLGKLDRSVGGDDDEQTLGPRLREGGLLAARQNEPELRGLAAFTACHRKRVDR